MTSRTPSPFVIHRETVRLVILAVIAALTFMLTRTFAAQRHAVEHGDAAAWHERGERALAEGDQERAIAAFRRAMLKRPEDPAYVLSLADALRSTGNLDAAARALVRVRELRPDDPVINRAVARVSAARHDVPAAIRYYHNALYGPWPNAEGPREVRLELIRFLLDNGDARRAVSELIAATTDLPETPAAHLQLARLFAEAGDAQHAFDYFASTLRMSPGTTAAVEGAVAAAFVLGDYPRAAAFALPADVSNETRERTRLAGLVVTTDPLAVRIGASTRRRRLLSLIDRVKQRARDCQAQVGSPVAGAAEVIAAIDALRIDRPAAERDQDAVENGVRLLAEATARLDAVCAQEPLDRAIALIAGRHGIDEP